VALPCYRFSPGRFTSLLLSNTNSTCTELQACICHLSRRPSHLPRSSFFLRLNDPQSIRCDQSSRRNWYLSYDSQRHLESRRTASAPRASRRLLDSVHIMVVYYELRICNRHAKFILLFSVELLFYDRTSIELRLLVLEERLCTLTQVLRVHSRDPKTVSHDALRQVFLTMLYRIFRACSEATTHDQYFSCHCHRRLCATTTADEDFAWLGVRHNALNDSQVHVHYHSGLPLVQQHDFAVLSTG